MPNQTRNHIGVIYFSHGKESGPWGNKIKQLAEVAVTKGFLVESPDYSAITNPDERAQRLLNLCALGLDNLVLVGSSMGGYVATITSEILKPQGLFLMAPAFYIEGYANQSPNPNAKLTSIVHGWGDEVIPVEHSIRFSQKHKVELYLVDGDHRLTAQIPFLTVIFSNFLDRIQALMK